MLNSRYRRALLILIAAAVVAWLAVPAGAAGGDLDATFGVGGKVTGSFPGGSLANAVAVQPDQKIVVVGATAGPLDNGAFAVARYASDGTLDPSFSGDGMVTTVIGGGGNEAKSVAIQADDKIVVAGTDDLQWIVVVRYLPDGTRDPAFGKHGKVRTSLAPTGFDIGYDVAIQSDGKIVVAGVAGTGDFVVLRYRRHGTLDPTFGDGGKMVFVHGGTARSLVLQPDGKIVVTGYTGWGFVVARLLPDGSRDRSFAGDGVLSKLADDSPARLIWPLAVGLQKNGKIVVAGDYDIFRSGIARLMPNGDLDATFGGDGVVVKKLGNNEQNFVGLGIQANGRIVAAGHVEPHEYGDNTIPHIVVARFLRDGSLDDTWSDNGKVSTSFEGGAGSAGIALQADGKAVVVGWADSIAMALVRYEAA
jgi:uncharacterized delta-60 repeat protein